MTTIAFHEGTFLPDLSFATDAYPQIAKCLADLEDHAATTADIVAGFPGAEDAARAAVEAATVAVGRAEQRLFNGTGSDEEVAAAKQRRARETARLNALYDAHAPKRQSATAAADVLAGVQRFLSGLRPAGGSRSIVVAETQKNGVWRHTEPHDQTAASDFEFITPTISLPKSGRWSDIVDAQRAVIAGLREEIVDIESAPPTAEYAKRQLRQIVADLGRKGEPGVTGLGRGERLAINWPRVDIGAEPARSGSGITPRPVDAAALLCWAMPDRVLEVLDRDVDEALGTEPLTVDPHDKPRKIRALKARILEAERIEAAAVWAGRAAGEDVAFRGDTSPKAVLGIA